MLGGYFYLFTFVPLYNVLLGFLHFSFLVPFDHIHTRVHIHLPRFLLRENVQVSPDEHVNEWILPPESTRGLSERSGSGLLFHGLHIRWSVLVEAFVWALSDATATPAVNDWRRQGT